ncbi:DUF6446 family protein [Pseudooceanicola sp. LIPI14-2-Ac024]|uniref:DUF6446 family protein n=1 Tax=Pseudooceanicola sp. LIPI14-2-Ac024 TaxID=3344875 RepID=UPI0035CE95EF
MNAGRIFAVIIVASALIVGASVYYLQVYAFYDEVGPSGPQDVTLVPVGSDTPEPVPHSGFRAIDADSSPIRYRACFAVDVDDEALAAFTPYPKADPLNAPGWFDCFDADEIGEALATGEARAYLSVPDVHYGIDRVIAVLPDGRGFAWHQINHCGEVVFDGQPAPEGCAAPPEGTARQ